MFDDREVCGTCRFLRHEYIDDGWVCTCPESEFCADWTEYSDKCDEWESRR